MDPARSTAASNISSSSYSSDAARESAHAQTQTSAASRAGYFRWVICAVLLFGVTKNYMDRNVIGVLSVTLQHDLHWSDIDYSNLVVVFQLAYAVGLLLAGPLIDRLGTRLGYTLAMIFWSLASMATALGGSFFSFAVSRGALGLGEAAVFPASIKAVAEWFPKKERALATGIFNAGTNVGVILAAWLVPWITLNWGWRASFVAVGALGFLWLALWLLIYRKPEETSAVSPAELAYIRSDPVEPPGRIPWLRLLPLRQTWSFVIGKFLTDPVWWFYLFWVPAFLQRQHGLALTQLGLPILVIYVIADFGSVAGGWISSAMIKRGATINAARKTAMLLSALCVLPVVLAYRVESTWAAVLLIGCAAAGHQGFSANLFTLASDMFPIRAVGSVVGLGGMVGALGGLCIATVVGHVLQWTGSYMVPFVIAGSAYLVALAMIQLLTPRIEPHHSLC
jgi:MFS transporter, ACS family, hexuronate transporter